MSAEQHLKTGKHPNDSRAEMTIMMLPSDANPKGNVFGGVILKYVDLLLVYAPKDMPVVAISSLQVWIE
jgi:acyl-CoA hydrolase